MKVVRAWMVAGMIMFGGGVALGEPSLSPGGDEPCPDCLRGRDTLTDSWFGLGRKLEEQGISAELSLTQVYQININGGLATHRRAGRYAGSYDLEMDFSLETMFNLTGAHIHLQAGGSWSDGLDPSSVGSLFNVNSDAGGDEPILLKQLYWQQQLLDGRLWLRVGKVDLTGGFDCRGCPASFDGNSYANSEDSQFLNGALVNNPTIPFPSRALGVVVHAEPVDGFYVSAAAADSHGDERETGFNTAFHGPDDFLGVFETGVAPVLTSARGDLPGAYRVGLWYDPQPKDRFKGGTKRDDVGFYVSLDQMLWREQADPADSQGLGVFARYGYADADVNDIRCFWSVGLQYQGLCPGRDEDVLGFGVAQGLLSPQSSDFTAPNETAYELYYRIVITPWCSISPSIQVVQNPGGDAGADVAVVPGIRARLSF